MPSGNAVVLLACLLLDLPSWQQDGVSAFAPLSGTAPIKSPSPVQLSQLTDDLYSEDHPDHSSAFPSKLKWKKKRFLMMKDVNESIQRRDPQAVSKAKLAVQRIQYWNDQHGESDQYFLPTLLQAYNLWIHAVARSQKDGKAAEDILRSMPTHLVQPNVVTYSSVMDAYAKQGHDKAPEHAERILFELLHVAEQSGRTDLTVTSVTCDTVLNAWAQQGTWNGAQRAQDILNRLEATETESLKPSLHSYSTVISGWANSRGGRPAAENAQALLDRTLVDSKNTKATVMRPDTVVFNSVIHAWATSGDPQAGTKAVKLLQQMQELSKKYDCAPDTVTYNTVLSAISHSGHIHAATKAESVLKQMVTEHRANPDTAPAANTISYNSVLHALSKSPTPGAAARAQKILQFMVRSKQNRIAPDVYSFTSVLDCLAKSKEPGKADKARALLDSLLEKYKRTKRPNAKLTQVPFNTVLNAAAFSAIGTPKEEQRRAIQVAVETFTLMRSEGVDPDMISYGNMLKAIANLMPPSPTRTEMALQVFGRCCQDGLVGDMVWNEARRAMPAKELSKRTGLQGSYRAMKIRDLPRPWTQNVKRMERKSSAKRFKPKEQKATPKQASSPVRRFRNISEQSYQSGRDL